jgi:maltose alpha-D-glucosyltransferase/alpha-amylase
MAGYLEQAALLGRRTADLHLALASAAGDPAFEPEALTTEQCRTLAQDMRGHALAAFAALGASLDRLPVPVAEAARQVIAAPRSFLSAFDQLAGLDPAVSRIRIHGDYHLGQVLCAAGDLAIVDFEGEPLRSIEERRRKQPAVKDLAGMLRSFSYVAHAALFERAGDRQDELARLEPWAGRWQGWASDAFLRAYLEEAGASPFVPRSSIVRNVLLRAFLLDKACYELSYELSARPDWLRIPLVGMLALQA